MILFVLATSSGCYWGEDFVESIDGKSIRIKDLKVGDRIKSLTSDGKSFVEDEILLMMDYQINRTG